MTSITDKNIRAGFYYLMHTTPKKTRIHTGMGPRHLAADAVDTDGGIYIGIDMLGDLPNFDLLANGTAGKLTMALSGVSEQVLALIDLDADVIQGVQVDIGFVQYNEDMQIAYAPKWLRGFRVSKLGLTLDQSGDETDDATHTGTASLTLRYGDARRKRNKGMYWTPDRQAGTDTGLRHMPDNVRLGSRQWPPPGK